MFHKGTLQSYDSIEQLGIIYLADKQIELHFSIADFPNSSLAPQLGERVKCLIEEQGSKHIAKFIVRLDFKNARTEQPRNQIFYSEEEDLEASNKREASKKEASKKNDLQHQQQSLNNDHDSAHIQLNNGDQEAQTEDQHASLTAHTVDDQASLKAPVSDPIQSKSEQTTHLESTPLQKNKQDAHPLDDDLSQLQAAEATASTLGQSGQQENESQSSDSELNPEDSRLLNTHVVTPTTREPVASHIPIVNSTNITASNVQLAASALDSSLKLNLDSAIKATTQQHEPQWVSTDQRSQNSSLDLSFEPLEYLQDHPASDVENQTANVIEQIQSHQLLSKQQFKVTALESIDEVKLQQTATLSSLTQAVDVEIAGSIDLSQSSPEDKNQHLNLGAGNSTDRLTKPSDHSHLIELAEIDPFEQLLKQEQLSAASTSVLPDRNTNSDLLRKDSMHSNAVHNANAVTGSNRAENRTQVNNIPSLIVKNVKDDSHESTQLQKVKTNVAYKNKNFKKSAKKINPWLVIIVIALLLLMAFAYFGYQQYLQHKQDQEAKARYYLLEQQKAIEDQRKQMDNVSDKPILSEKSRRELLDEQAR